MAQFTVTWRGQVDDFIVTTVELEESVNPYMLSTNTWADMAWAAENTAAGIPEDEWGPKPSDTGYDMISVVRGVPEFIY
jgi:hypothetical protein